MKNIKKALIIMTAAVGIFTGVMGANAADETTTASNPDEPAIITKVKNIKGQNPFIKLDDRNFLNAASYQKIKTDLKDKDGNTIQVKTNT